MRGRFSGVMTLNITCRVSGRTAKPVTGKKVPEGSTHVRAKIMMQHKSQPSRPKQVEIVFVQIVRDVDIRGCACQVQRLEHRQITASHGIDAVDGGRFFKSLRNFAAGFRVQAAAAARIQDRQTRPEPFQFRAKTMKAFFFALEGMLAKSCQH